ncbi:MAG: MarR family winged helix-turn-helix transcriptional regulator [Caldimonas sp.]|uniref:MarR family winged helix-turn-helix transcriptional regulator n=1 Tax=Caldimonas sp. TaxID=2838790 RepID=UPI00391C5ED7
MVSHPSENPTLPAEVLRALRSFRMIVRSIKQHFQHVQEATGVSGSQLWCLVTIQSQPGIRVTQLAQALGIQQATASNLVESLDRKGLVERRRDQRDQRVVSLFLSEAGARIAQSAPQPVAGILPDALERLDPSALAQLNGLLEQVISLMALQAPDGRDVPLADA